MGIATRIRPRPVWWKRISIGDVVRYALIAAFTALVLDVAITINLKARENAAFFQVASQALYRERCREIGGVNSETETKLCIVGSKTVNVHQKNYAK